jgi:hypothetical protein
MVLYAEGFSVAEFLVERSSRPAFLAFVASGMREGWDQAARVHYRYNNVEELEQAWINQLRSPRRPAAPALMARNTAPAADPNRGITMRQTIPPSLVTLSRPAPVVRGQIPEQEPDRPDMNARGPDGRPLYLPGFAPAHAAAPPAPAPAAPITGMAARDPWQPAAAASPEPQIRLGPPQAVPNPPLMPSPSHYPSFTPIGYPQ